MKQMLSGPETRAGGREPQARLEVFLGGKMISGQMMSGAQHRFSKRHVVGIPRLQCYFFAPSGDLARPIYVCRPTRIHEQPTEEPKLVGQVVLFDRNVERPTKAFADALVAALHVHQRQWQ